jgi:hypothetical protein
MPTLRALAAQTAARHLELLVVVVDPVVPRADLQSRLEGLLPRLAGRRVLTLKTDEDPRSRHTAKTRANVLGLAQARTSWVVFSEDHVLPDPEWARHLLARIARGGPELVAIGPRLLNANPATRASWADLLLNYQPWSGTRKPPCRTGLAPHNCAYHERAFGREGTSVEDALEHESALHTALHTAGFELAYEPRARVAHINVSRIRSLLHVHLLAGRHYAGHRNLAWSTARRWSYVLASPLIPLVRLARTLARWPDRTARVPGPGRVIPALVLATVADAFGQALGYAAGIGNAARGLRNFEFDRMRHVTERDRALFESAAFSNGGLPATGASHDDDAWPNVAPRSCADDH